MSGYGDFLDNIVHSTGAEVEQLYHLVRQIPYGGVGQRDPQKVYDANLGSCSGKHILLRDLLRSVGHSAEIITIFTHFNKRIPICATMSKSLAAIIKETEVPDYHHFVRVAMNAGPIDLDATWHDALLDYGFPVNASWEGIGNTILAGDPIIELPAFEDISANKARLLDTLSKEDTELRAHFLTLLGDWLDSSTSD